MLLYGMTKLAPKYARKSFTFSEIFTLASLLSIYVQFSIVNSGLIGKLSPNSAGNTQLNMLIFAPWVCLSVFLVCGLLCLLFGVRSQMVIWGISSISLIGSVFLFYGSTVNLLLLWKFITKPVNIKTIFYMAIVLAFGLPFIYSIVDVKNP